MIDQINGYLPSNQLPSQAFSEPFYPPISRAWRTWMALVSCPACQGQQRSLRKMPGLELGVGAFARGAEPGMSAIGVLLRGGLVPPPVRRADSVLAEVTLVAQHDQARGGADPDRQGSQPALRTGEPGRPASRTEKA